ncbi:hypothetical protein HAX54_007885 [Datura stramonium]|uniref:Uncharacterized protein n=1 Tax=Datura stramonium TaxID=4076 RepID=A0ABS8TCG8_DATST|nr:hypothetical protein [Datura stramonium]
MELSFHTLDLFPYGDSALGLKESKLREDQEAHLGYIFERKGWSSKDHGDERLSRQEGEQLWERINFLDVMTKSLEGWSVVDKEALADANDRLSEI